MISNLTPFPNPVYITRPVLPDLIGFTKRLEEIWADQWLANNGKQHQILEEKLREVLKVPYLSLFNNGTTALNVAVRVLDLKGDVITTPFTFAATPHALTWANLQPVFCDIDPVTMNIDPGRIESMITPTTSAILAVHVFGTPCNVVDIQKIADKHGIKVVYDAAHAFGVEADGVGIGNFGDVSMFSFHATKLFHTAEGGALAFGNSDLKNKINLAKNFGIKNQEEVVTTGINGKMNEIQAALGLAVLEMLDEEKEKRRNLAKIYRQCLQGVPGVTCLPVLPEVKNAEQFFVIRIDKTEFGCSRDEVFQKMKDYNVFTRKYFYPLCSRYDCYRNLPSSAPENLPVAEKVGGEVLCLPFYGALSEHDVEKICSLLVHFSNN